MVAVQLDTTTLDAVIDTILTIIEASPDGLDYKALLEHFWALSADRKITYDQYVKLVEVLAQLIKDSVPFEKVFEYGIGVALSHDAVRIGRQIAARGVELDPGSELLAKIARIIAPPKVIETHLPPRQDLTASVLWLQEHSREYAGKWVALENGRLLGSTEKRKTLVEQLGNPSDMSHIMITWIP